MNCDQLRVDTLILQKQDEWWVIKILCRRCAGSRIDQEDCEGGEGSAGASAAKVGVVSSKVEVDGCADSSPSSSSSFIISLSKLFCEDKNQIGQTIGRTISVDVRILSEAILHRLELLDTINPFRLFFRENETRKGFAELHTAGTISHPTEARAVPVDFPSDGVKGTLRGRFFLRRCTLFILVQMTCFWFWDVWRWR